MKWDIIESVYPKQIQLPWLIEINKLLKNHNMIVSIELISGTNMYFIKKNDISIFSTNNINQLEKSLNKILDD